MALLTSLPALLLGIALSSVPAEALVEVDDGGWWPSVYGELTPEAMAEFRAELAEMRKLELQVEGRRLINLTYIQYIEDELEAEREAARREAARRAAANRPPATSASPSSSTSSSSSGRGMGSNVEQWRPLVEAHFPADAVDRMMCLMRHESGGNPSAKNPRSSARGLFQILGSLWAPHFGVAQDDLYDAETNVRLARKIWDQQGYRAWSPWNRGLCR